MIAPALPAALEPVRRLPGMRDWPDAACRRREAALRRLSDFIARRGYGRLEVPLLEPTELFLRKSGGALAARMYSFTDPGSNAVSLRPEFTASVMRHYLATVSDGSADVPARWQYAGPVFRYDPYNSAASGQFTQVGAELIGVAGISADAELLTLAAGLPAELGITDYCVRLADLDVLDSVLDTAAISERARSFIIANMNRIAGGAAGVDALLRRAAELHIVAGGALAADESDLAAAIAGLPDDAARSVLAGFMRWRDASGSSGAPLGRRTPDEIISRLLHKLRGGDAPDAVRRGLELAARLASVSGPPAAAIAQAQTIAADAGADTAAVNRLGALAGRLESDTNLRGRLRVDFALARGIAYYNGIIFDLVQERAAGDNIALGGGGRYDALARAPGGQADIPALGFACTLETLLDAMPGRAPDLA